MQKRSISLGVIFIIFATQTMVSPAFAILGLSKCEKLNKSLNQEQKIGFENWKTFDRNRDQVVNKLSTNLREYMSVISDVNIVLKSDIAIYKQVEKNKKCFSTKFLADNRSNLDRSQKTLNSYNKGLRDFDKLDSYAKSSNVSRDFLNQLRDYYANFSDWKSGERIN